MRIGVRLYRKSHDGYPRRQGGRPLNQVTSHPTRTIAASGPCDLICWGHVRIRDRSTGRDIVPKSRKVRALIAYLGRQGITPVPRERIAALLWGSSGSHHARASLRQAIRQARALPVAKPLISSDRESVRLNEFACITDIDRLRRLACEDDFDGIAAVLSAAAPLFGGDLDGLTDEFDAWLRIERAAADRERNEIVGTAAERAFAAGRHGSAEAIVRETERIDPTDERTARVAMRIAAAKQDPAVAERRYQRLALTLRRDLDVAPSGETEALRRSIACALTPRAAPAPVAASGEAGADGLSEAARPPTRPLTTRRDAMLLLAGTPAVAALSYVGLRFWRPEPVTLFVMPFRAAAARDARLAEGIADEIAASFSRREGIRTIGRTSARALAGSGLGGVEIARRLDASHVVDGQVRRAGGRIQIAASLMEARHGDPVWSNSYQGDFGEIFALQRALVDDVATQLGGGSGDQDARSPPSHPQTFALYLTARGLLRTRDRRDARTARELLENAVSMSPDYAPAWSALAMADWVAAWMSGQSVRQRAIQFARRALALDPNLAEAHATLGMMLETGPAAIRHLERAAALAPDDSEVLYWLSGMRMRQGDFERAIAAARRMAALDPFWIRSTAFAEQAWSLGYHAEAEAFEHRIANGHPDPAARALSNARMAARRGEWSRYVPLCERAARLDSAGYREEALISAVYGRVLLGLPYNQHAETPVTLLWARAMEGELGDLTSLPGWDGDPQLFWNLPDIAAAGSRILIRAGRSAELVSLYDRAYASPEAMATNNAGHGFGYHAPGMALALRSVGRTSEAEQILKLVVDRALRMDDQPRLPPDARVVLAGVWASVGSRDRCLQHLDRAMAHGWPRGARRHPWVPRPVLASEPAFQPLGSDPRLLAVDASVREQLARERAKLERSDAASV